MYDTKIIQLCQMHLKALDLMELESTYHILMEYGKTQTELAILKKAGFNLGITFPDRYFESLCFYRTQLEKDLAYIYKNYPDSILNPDVNPLCQSLEQASKKIILIIEILSPLL